jgi:protease YdgD
MKRSLRVLYAVISLILPLSGPVLGQQVTSSSVVDASKSPWSGIAMVTNSVYGRCTGVLINTRTVLTAAHCLYSRRTLQYVRPQSVHVLLGYDRGLYGFHSVATSFRIGTGYNPERPSATAISDWAVLTLEMSAPSAYRPFPVAPVPETGHTVLAAGFAQERSEVITRTPACAIEGHTENGLIVSDCDVSQGLSGGPLIDAESLSVIALQVAITEKGGRLYALSIPIAAINLPIDP